MQIREADIRRFRMLSRIIIPPVTDPVFLRRLGFGFNFSLRDANTMSRKMHHHSAYEIHFVLKGSMEYRFESGERFLLREREFLFIPPKKKHKIDACSDDCIRVSLVFEYSDKDAADLILRFSKNPYVDSITDEMESVFSLLLSTAEHADSHIQYRVRELVMLLIWSLAEKREQDADEEDSSKEDIRLVRAKQYITDNCSRTVTVGEVAAYVHLSQRQLERLFKAKEGGSIFRYIQQERCNAAKIFLLESDKSFSEIADHLEFSNEYNFIRFFKKTEGMTPKKFQQSFKKR